MVDKHRSRLLLMVATVLLVPSNGSSVVKLAAESSSQVHDGLRQNVVEWRWFRWTAGDAGGV